MRDHIIAHRGLWLESKLIPNSFNALKAAMENGFSIETDIRDNSESIIINHDPLYEKNIQKEYVIKLSEIFLLGKELNYESKFYLNIKSDGLSESLSNLLINYPQIKYTTFDQSVPDLLLYKEKQLNYSIRISPYEENLSLQEPLRSIIFDPLKILDFYEKLKTFVMKNSFTNVCIISPELHGCYDEIKRNTIWQIIKDLRIHYPLLSICTDYPFLAYEFFS